MAIWLISQMMWGANGLAFACGHLDQIRACLQDANGTGDFPSLQRLLDAVRADEDIAGPLDILPTVLVLHLSNLGNALQARFERTGSAADLDEAIRAGRAAVQATPRATRAGPGACPTWAMRCWPSPG